MESFFSISPLLRQQRECSPRETPMTECSTPGGSSIGDSMHFLDEARKNVDQNMRMTAVADVSLSKISTSLNACIYFAIRKIKENPIIVLRILAEKNIIEISEDVYAKFLTLQQWFLSFPNYPSADDLQTKMDELDDLLTQVHFTGRERDAFISFLGEEFASGRFIDFLTLYILFWLDGNNVTYEVLLSERSGSYLRFMERLCIHSEGREERLISFDGNYDETEGNVSSDFWFNLYECVASNKPLLDTFHSLHMAFCDHIKLMSVLSGRDQLFLCFNRKASLQSLVNLINEVARHHLIHVQSELSCEADDIRLEMSEEGILRSVELGNNMFREIVTKNHVCSFLNSHFSARCFNQSERLRTPEIVSRGKHSLPIVVVSKDMENISKNERCLEIDGEFLDSVIDFKNVGIEGLVETKVNLLEYPKAFDATPKLLTIGDLHANALMLIHRLVLKQIISISEEDYHELVNAIIDFNDPIEDPQEARDKIRRLEECLKKISLSAWTDLIRVVCHGDESADRFGNDIVLLLFLELLCDKDIEIIFSNHGLCFIQYAMYGYPSLNERVCDKENKQQMFLNYIIGKPEAYRSLINFSKLLELLPELKERVNSIFESVYKKKLRLLSYYKEDNTVSLMFHGCCGPGAAQACAGALKLPFEYGTPERLLSSIDKLNKTFLARFFDIITYIEQYFHISNPFVDITESRLGDVKRNKKLVFNGLDEFIKNIDYIIQILHGHSGPEGLIRGLEYCTGNLDGDTGRPGVYEGIVRTFER